MIQPGIEVKGSLRPEEIHKSALLSNRDNDSVCCSRRITSLG